MKHVSTYHSFYGTADVRKVSFNVLQKSSHPAVPGLALHKALSAASWPTGSFARIELYVPAREESREGVVEIEKVSEADGMAAPEDK